MKKCRLRVWQFIVLLLPLVALPIVMFFPYFEMDEDVVKDATYDLLQSIKEDVEDSSSKYKDDILDYWDKNLNEKELEESIEQSTKKIDFDRFGKESKKLSGADLSFVSGWNLLSLKVDFSTNELKDELRNNSSNPLTQFAIASMASKITEEINDTANEGLIPVRVTMWVIFILCVILILMSILTYTLKWNKFVVTPAVAVLGGVEVLFASMAIWGVSGSIGAETSDAFSKSFSELPALSSQFSGNGSDLTGFIQYGDVSAKLLGKTVMYLYENMISAGVWMLFFTGILAIAASVIVMLFGNSVKLNKKGTATKPSYPVHVPGIIGVQGTYAGADIALESIAVSVGSNSALCQLVVDGPYVNEKEFTIYYNVSSQEYIIEWSSLSGWIEKALPPGSMSDYEINSVPSGIYQLRSGTRICIAGGQEVFMLR